MSTPERPTLPPVVLVEDNPDDETLFREAWRRAHIAAPLVVVRDGAEAVDRVTAPSPAALPALVLLDLKLPSLSGAEVIARLRADPRTATVPVVVLSGSVGPHDIEACYAAGASSFLFKPADFAALEDLVRSVAHYWLRINEPPPAPR